LLFGLQAYLMAKMVLGNGIGAVQPSSDQGIMRSTALPRHGKLSAQATSDAASSLPSFNRKSA
jgi:hypothetical protein